MHLKMCPPSVLRSKQVYISCHMVSGSHYSSHKCRGCDQCDCDVEGYVDGKLDFYFTLDVSTALLPP